MPHVDFIWFEKRLAKIAEHGITRDEAEFVLVTADSAAIKQSRTSDRMTVEGYTRGRRFIMVVFDWADADKTTVVPVTAYERD